MADIPDQPVLRRVENIVERDGQFDDAQPGAEMAAGDRNRVDCLGAQLARQLRQLAFAELPKVGRRVDAIEKRGGGTAGHTISLLTVLANRRTGAETTVRRPWSSIAQRFGSNWTIITAEPDLLHPHFGLFEEMLAALFQRFAALIDRDRLGERHVAPLKPIDDLLEFGESRFECHAVDGWGVGQTILR